MLTTKFGKSTSETAMTGIELETFANAKKENVLGIRMSLPIDSTEETVAATVSGLYAPAVDGILALFGAGKIQRARIGVQAHRADPKAK